MSHQDSIDSGLIVVEEVTEIVETVVADTCATDSCCADSAKAE